MSHESRGCVTGRVAGGGSRTVPKVERVRPSREERVYLERRGLDERCENEEYEPHDHKASEHNVAELVKPRRVLLTEPDAQIERGQVFVTRPRVSAAGEELPRDGSPQRGRTARAPGGARLGVFEMAFVQKQKRRE